METSKAATQADATEDVRLGVYMRVSGDEQKRQGTIETQRSVLTRYIDREDLTGAVFGWYEDEAVSGAKVAFPKRAAGARLLSDVRSGNVNVVLVRRLDRLGRNARETLNAVHELETAGARLVSLKENVDTGTPAGRLFLTVLAGVAEFERDLILERSAEGISRRLESTTWMGGRAPYGYRVEGSKRDARLVINGIVDAESGYSELDVFRLSWHLLVEQDWTCQRIAEYLTSTDIPTREDAPRWAPAVIGRMLADPIYTGERTYRTKDGTVHTHPVPAILTTEQWQRARAKLREHRRYSHKSPDHDYLLKGLLRCGLCGAPYTTSWARSNLAGGAKGDKWRYYACSTRHYRQQYHRRHMAVPHECVGASVDAVKLEEAIWADIEQFIRDPARVLTQLAEKRDTDAAQVEQHRARFADLEHVLQEIQGERDAVVALFRRGRISERDLDRQLDDIAAEEVAHIKERDQLLAAMQGDTDDASRLEAARALLQQLHARLDTETITPELKREMVQLLVARIVVETVEVGLSTRGRMKRRAKVRVAYTFDAPADDQAATAHQQDLCVSPPACRQSDASMLMFTYGETGGCVA